jgi:hypothetical protein
MELKCLSNFKNKVYYVAVEVKVVGSWAQFDIAFIIVRVAHVSCFVVAYMNAGLRVSRNAAY